MYKVDFPDEDLVPSSALVERHTPSPVVQPENCPNASELDPCRIRLSDLDTARHNPDFLRATRPDLTPAHLWWMAAEREFEVEASPACLLLEQIRAIKADASACPLCLGSREANTLGYGVKTGLRVLQTVPCECSTHHSFWARCDEVLPLAFRDATLKSRPRTPGQAQAFSQMSEKPLDSYYLWSREGKRGKSYAACALVRKLLWWETLAAEGRALPEGGTPLRVFYVEVSEWIQEYVAWARRRDDHQETKMPLLPETIRRWSGRGFRPVLVLSELDHFAPTETRCENMRALVNATFEAKGQIIATANSSPDDLKGKWGETLAGITTWRITTNGHTIQF